MNHAVLTEYLADYLEGDLALDRRALVDAHLDGCPTCAQEVREMQQTIRLLRALPQPEMPPMIAANVMRRIRAGETQPSVLERIERIFGGVLEPSFVLPASAVAVAALVIVVIQGGGPLSRSLVVVEGPGPTERSLAPEAEAGLVAHVDEGVRAVGHELDRTFGASAVESALEEPRPLARSESAETSPASASAEAYAPIPEAEPAAERSIRESSPEMALAVRDPMATPAWASKRSRVAGSRTESAGAFFGSGGLAQGLASDVVSGRSPGFSNEAVTAVPVTLSRRREGDPGLVADGGGEDPRDVWIARALAHPADFARYIARHNLAEQELWVERLGERAQSRGLLGELVDALRSAGDEKASWLADDFAAQVNATTEGDAKPTVRSEPGGDSGR